MKLSFYFILFFNFLLIPMASLSQKVSSNKKAQTAFEKANKHLNLSNKAQAIEELNKAIHYDPAFASATQMLGDIYRSEKDFKKAIPLYQQTLASDPNLTTLTMYALGESLVAEGRYEEALPYLNQYLNTNISARSKALVSKYIADCEFGLKYSHASAAALEKLPNTINTKNNEYFPKLTADNEVIIFTRKENNRENFYESNFDGKIWSEAQKLTNYINSEQFNEGAHCISPDGKYLFFTGCNRPNGFGSCDIYVSKKENNQWSVPHNLGQPINSKAWESQPAISADGRTLYFVSNRDGGFGGNDIWKSELGENGQWQTPINLGDQINTIFDESAPFIHADNKTIYFASNGWPGFGQTDLFKSTFENEQWSTPLNLGSPINNHYDQTSIQITMSGNLGFISSQDSSRQLDIFTFEVPYQIKPHPVVFIQGTVFDEETKEILAATITVTNTSSDKIVFQDISDIEDGQFIATLPLYHNYAVHVHKEGYLFDSEQYDMRDSSFKDEKFTKDIFLRPIKKGYITQLNNIYFNTDKYNLLPSSEVELRLLLNFLKINANVKIEVSGHTDNSGNKAHNQKLSENRAAAVSNYLIEKGIDKTRILSIGYGDNKPIADNSTHEGKQLNRRTEFKIL